MLSIPNERDSLNLHHLSSLKEKNEDLKILISVGGWGAEGFSDAALTEESRKKFTESSISFMKRFNLDGVDLDWEYPGQIGGGNVFRPEDKENFTLMLQSLRTALDDESKKENRTGKDKYLLTIATGGDPEYLKHTDLGKAHVFLDYINIMTYDLYHGNDTVTGHHSPLFQSKKEKQSRNSSHIAVMGHVEAGVPIGKIVLGVPFYGRGWKNVNDEDNGLYQPAKGPHFALGYDSLKEAYINKHGFKRYWDEEAKAPYLWNDSVKTFISYADEESLKHKIDYIKEKGLRGVMFWEYSHDLKEGALLNQLSF